MKTTPIGNEVKKLHVQETVQFAIDNIPGIDQKTLQALLDLVNVDGTHGSISRTRLLAKMRLVLKYVPETCLRSLVVLADLLELPISSPRAALQEPDAGGFTPGISVAQLLQASVFDEAL